jgi:hypothetical protein
MRYFIALCFALLAGCATAPRSVDVSQQQIERALARRFPYEARAGELFTLKAGTPRVTPLPDENRLRLDFVVELRERFAGSVLRSNLALSFALRWEPSDATLRLAAVRIENMDLRGLPERWRTQLQPAAARAVDQLLDGAVLHQFRPEDLARAGGWTPGEIRVTSAGVRVQLLPPAP